jgi:NTE family protein
LNNVWKITVFLVKIYMRPSYCNACLQLDLQEIYLKSFATETGNHSFVLGFQPSPIHTVSMGLRYAICIFLWAFLPKAMQLQGQELPVALAEPVTDLHKTPRDTVIAEPSAGTINLLNTGGKVGLVLSGGAAKGFAHIGVIQALEENGIPIDYITGTSAGALVGAMYAAGYSPQQMTTLITKHIDKVFAAGTLLGDDFYFRKDRVDGTFLNVPLSLRGKSQLLPENFVSDYEVNILLAQMLSGASAAAHNNFDSLFVPFRAMAADIFENRALEMNHTSLPFAVRASMAVPLFFSPASNDQYRNLYDGGVYDNFPVESMIDNFDPDYLIGVYVNSPKTTREEIEDRGAFISQLLFATTRQQGTYEKIPPYGLFIQPDLSKMSLSEFTYAASMFAIRQGYETTMACMDDIKQAVSRRVDSSELALRRMQFWARVPPLVLGEVEITGVSESEAFYVRQKLKINPGPITFDDVRKAYHRLYTETNYLGTFPELIYNPATGQYTLKFFVRPAARFNLRFGGAFYSPTEHQLHLGADYHGINYLAYTLSLDLMRGSFQNYAGFRVRFDFPYRLPVFFELNNYVFSNRLTQPTAAFFNVARQANVDFLAAGLEPSLGFQFNSRSRMAAGWRILSTRDRFYQNPQALVSDTLDVQNFSGSGPYAMYYTSSLNRKMYPDNGQSLYISAHYSSGNFEFRDGKQNRTTTYESRQSWLQARIQYQSFARPFRQLGFGLTFEAAYSTLPPLNTFRGTLLAAPVFQPFQESPTLFLPEFYCTAWAAPGVVINYRLNKKLHLRAEGHWMQRFVSLALNDQNQLEQSFQLDFINLRAMAITAGIWLETTIGPIGLFGNYYETKNGDPVRAFLHLGYMIFKHHPLW